MIKHALVAMLLAGGVTNAPGVLLQDESMAQGRVQRLNCVGAGISCSAVGYTGILTVTGGAGGGTGGGQATEMHEAWPVPEDQGDSKALRVTQTTLEGATLTISRPVQFNKIIFYVTNRSGSPTIKIMLFQAPDGTSGPTAARVATITAFPVGATGTFIATPAEGTVTLAAGLIYVLYGRDSVGGSVTIRTFSNKGMDLLTQNVNLNTHPTVYTTAIASTTTPATIATRQSPTGDLIGEPTNSLAPVFRLLNL